MDDLSKVRLQGGRLPVWLRIAVVLALTVLAAGASLFAYRWYARPVTLSIAVGSLVNVVALPGATFELAK